MPARPLPHPEAGSITLDRVLAALADPTRRDILRRIAAEGPLYCGDLHYDISRSTLSHHVKFLREAGLMHTEVMGKHRQITRRDDTIERLFPGLLEAVGLAPGQGRHPEPQTSPHDQPGQQPPSSPVDCQSTP
jgi:DNA-binding transcriptional ArsR family regulator